MGGLVARSAIEEFGSSQYVKRLITLGTPHRGASVTAIRYFLGEIVRQSAGMIASEIYNYRTQGFRDLYSLSDYIKKMNTTNNPPIPYYAIACTNDESKWFNCSAIIPGPDDGVVSVESAKGVQGADNPKGIVNIPIAIAHIEMTHYHYHDIFDQIINYLKDFYSPPTISTNVPASITPTSVVIGGNLNTEGGTPVSEKGVFYSTSNKPEASGTKIKMGSGSGLFSGSVTGLLGGTKYYIRAYATNSDGTSYGNLITFSTTGVTDIEGNVYNTIKIGTQIWMAENLKTTKYNNGEIIGTTVPATFDYNLENNPKYQWAYNGDESNVAIYGRLYTWYAVTDSRGINPKGWHVATNSDYVLLRDYLIANGYNYDGTTSVNKIAKSLASKTHWNTNFYTGAPGNDFSKNNTSGFTAVPGGWRLPTSGFLDLGQSWNTWSYDGSFWIFNSAYSDFCYGFTSNRNGLSVRCIKD